MYMTDWCPYCRKAREYLQSLNVDLVEYNVEKNREKAAEFKAKGGSGVPLIDVEGTVIKGYNQESIKSAVEERRDANPPPRPRESAPSPPPETARPFIAG